MKIGKPNMNLHHRIFMLLLTVGLVSFLIAGAISLAGMYSIRENLDKTGALMADNAAAFTETFAVEQVKKQLSTEADGKARLINLEMETTLDDAYYLAKLMGRILTNPQNYSQRRLLNAQTDVVPSGRAYVNVSRKLARQNVGSDYAAEIGLAANITDDLEQMKDWYTAAFVGSVHGWLIAVDVTPDDSAKQFSESFLESYDPRKMGWYTLAAKNEKAGFTGLYTDSNGSRCVTCVAPFYGPGGLAGVVGIDCNPDTIFRVTQNDDDPQFSGMKLEQSRFILENATGSVIFSTFINGPLAVPQEVTDLRKSEDKNIARVATAMASGKKDVMLMALDGEERFLAFAPIENTGWSYGVLKHKREVVYPAVYARENMLTQMRSFAESVHDSFRSRLKGALAIFLFMLVALFFISSAIAKRFVQPILVLVEGVKHIAQGNLDEKVEVPRTDELALLADSVNDMAGNLKEHIHNLSVVTAEKERIATELSVAKEIQEGMLPRNFGEISQNGGFDLFATMDAAKEVGGDFYDFYMLDEHRLAFTIGDVSGKGVPAALFMVIAKTVLENSALSAGATEDFAEVIRQANQQMCKNNEEMLFVTVFFGVLDTRTGDLTYVNCGHNPPLLRQGRDGQFDYLRPAKKNLMLGVEEDISCTQETLRMEPGSMLFCYTDGVTEAMNAAKEVYSEKRLQAALETIKGDADMPVADMLAAVRQDVNAHVNGVEQSDDITMLAIRYTG